MVGPMTKLTTCDANGREVHVGDRIRVLSIDMEALHFLSKREQNDIKSMIGDVFEVEEIGPSGTAKITKWFNRGEAGLKHTPSPCFLCSSSSSWSALLAPDRSFKPSVRRDGRHVHALRWHSSVAPPRVTQLGC